MTFQPPVRYSRINAGPGWIRQYETQNSVPLSASKAILVDPELGSPFTISIVPPQVLIDALAGGANARVGGLFDRLLLDQRQAVAESIPSGATLTEQQQSLLGTRTPVAPTSNIIETALKAHNNFGKMRQRRDQAPKILGRRGDDSDVPVMDPLITSSGQQFDPSKQHENRNANQNAVADVTQARSVAAQLSAVRQTPPLTLLVNPQNLTITYTKKQTYQDRSRYNYIFQPWGEDLPKLSVQGKTGAFVAGSVGTEEDTSTGRKIIRTAAPSGVQWATRRDSQAFQTLANLITLYRNNAYLYDPQGSEAHRWVGVIQIEYDQFVYQGNFTNFTYGYNESAQLGGIEFSFEFGVSAMFDTAQDVDVAPQRSPTPSPSDASWQGQQTQPSPLPSSSSARPTQEGEAAQSVLLSPVLL